MRVDLAPGCSVEVERGPDWLFVRLPGSSVAQDQTDLANRVWALLEQGFMHRVVLELDEVEALTSPLIAELLQLHRRVSSQGGMMRLAGLSEGNQTVLRRCKLAEHFPQYQSREAAVMGNRPGNPR